MNLPMCWTQACSNSDLFYRFTCPLLFCFSSSKLHFTWSVCVRVLMRIGQGPIWNALARRRRLTEASNFEWNVVPWRAPIPLIQAETHIRHINEGCRLLIYRQTGTILSVSPLDESRNFLIRSFYSCFCGCLMGPPSSSRYNSDIYRCLFRF